MPDPAELLPLGTDAGASTPASLSPATTPGSTIHGDEERCLTSKTSGRAAKVSAIRREKELRDMKKKWSESLWSLAPCFMAVVSIVQVLVFMLADEPTEKLLRFEPVLRYQSWRFVSYMLLHWSKTHLVLNVLIQCLIAIPLEVEQGGWRTVAVYLWGGVFGALGACLLQPQPMVGASAGVYAVLMSHLAHLYLNSNIVKYRKYRTFSVCVLSISDFIFYAFHANTAGHPPISLGAHASGGLAGALLGLLIYTGSETDKSKMCVRNWVRIFTGFVILGLLAAAIVAMSLLPPTFFVR